MDFTDKSPSYLSFLIKITEFLHFLLAFMAILWQIATIQVVLMSAMIKNELRL